MDEVRYLSAGEQGLVVEFGKEIDARVNQRVYMLAKTLRAKANPAIIEVVPTYRSLLVYFDSLTISRENLCGIIKMILDTSESDQGEAGWQEAKVVDIPVCYGGEYGSDLNFVAEYNGRTVDEVINIHSSVYYQVYMLGFTPGFPYLGGMSEKIAAPRLEKPRIRIPAGAVGIAGTQTGFYPVESPGGWRLIGRTPVKAFDPGNSNPFLFSSGDYLRFIPITPDEYDIIRTRVEGGTYIVSVSSLQGVQQS